MNYEGKNKHTVRDYSAVAKGTVFGWWKVIGARPIYRDADDFASRYAWAECVCEYCGQEKNVRILHLIKGRSNSCCKAPAREIKCETVDTEGW